MLDASSVPSPVDVLVARGAVVGADLFAVRAEAMVVIAVLAEPARDGAPVANLAVGVARVVAGSKDLRGTEKVLEGVGRLLESDGEVAAGAEASLVYNAEAADNDTGSYTAADLTTAIQIGN